MSFVNLPQFGGGGVETYADFASLPSGLPDGSVGVTLDTDSLYIYNAGTSSWVIVGAAGVLTGLSGDVVATGPGVAASTIQPNAITATKIQDNAVTVAKIAALTALRAMVTDASGKLSASGVTATELAFLIGVTSAIQNQLDGKQPTGNYITSLTGDVAGSGPGAAPTSIQTGVITNSMINGAAAIALFKLAALTALRALVTDGSGVITISAVTATELGYLSGVTSSVQTQLNGKQATGNYITALSGDVVANGPGSATSTIQTDAVTTSKIQDGAVTNAKIAAGAGIPDSKLATISTPGKVANAATTANAGTVADTIALRGGVGQLFAQFYVLSPYATNNSFYAGDLAEANGVNVTNLQNCTATFVSDTMEFIVEILGVGQLHCVCDVLRTGVTVLSDRSNNYLSSDAGTGFYIGKTSTSSRVITFKNRMGSTQQVRIYAINSTLSVTAWA